ncbi:MAG: NAD(P)-dependent oxidoreductase [Candidatus Bilamarchaeaceae archaeon]
MGINRDNYSSLFGQYFDVFINANGNSKKLLAAREPKLDFEMNVQTTLNTLFDFKIRKYVYLSSVDVYNDVSNPLNNYEDVIIKPELLSNYGFDKYLGELLVKKYAQNWLILRLGGMIGEGLKKNPIYDIIYLKKLFINPKSQFQFINTAVVAKIIEKLLMKNKEVFNVCGKGAIMLDELITTFSINLQDYGTDIQHYEINTKNRKYYTSMIVPLCKIVADKRKNNAQIALFCPVVEMLLQLKEFITTMRQLDGYNKIHYFFLYRKGLSIDPYAELFKDLSAVHAKEEFSLGTSGAFFIGSYALFR